LPPRLFRRSNARPGCPVPACPRPRGVSNHGLDLPGEMLYKPGGTLTGRGFRPAFAAALLIGLLLFDGVGGFYALKTIKHRYYVPGNGHVGARTAAPPPAAPEAGEGCDISACGRSW
jgi:hypothetical protein